MAVTLNIKASKTFPELFPTVMNNLDPEVKVCLGNAEIYYQTHCFDVLHDCGAGRWFIARFQTNNTGALLQGLLGNKPLLELTKSVSFCMKAWVTALHQDSPANNTLTYQNATACTMHYGFFHGYYEFLDQLGEAKACPAGHKPKVGTAEPEPVGLDFAKLAAKNKEHVSEVEQEQEQVPADSTVKLEHGITQVNTTYYTAFSKEHKQAPVVKLKVATALGQRVAGTHPTSIYIACGLSSTINAAYRVFGDKFSVRLEPKKGVKIGKHSKMVDNLIACGLDTHFDGDLMSHASLHFEGMNYKSCRRVLGAIMADVNLFEPHECTLTIKES